MSDDAAVEFDQAWLHQVLLGDAPESDFAPAPPTGGLPAELDHAVLTEHIPNVFNATRGVYKSRRQKKAKDAEADPDAPPAAATTWASKRPAGSGPRQVEAGDVTCPGKPGELPGCYFPYSLPDADSAGERIRWNAVKFNPRNGEEDKVFRELDPVDRIVLHLARARSRLAAALGIWRKTDRQPFKTVTAHQMALFMVSATHQMSLGHNSEQPSFDPAASGTNMLAAQTMEAAGLNKATSDHEYLALPRVASWLEKFEELADEEVWTQYLIEDAEGALAAGYKWSKHINGRPDIGLFSWRNGEKIAREGVSDAKFRTQYSQSWNYLDLALRHIYEAVRLLALRSAQLTKAGEDATDERLRRLAILPADARLLIFAAFAFPTYLGTPIDAGVPSHLLKFSPIDAISRALTLDLHGEGGTLKVTRIVDEDGKNVVISRPVFAAHAIAAHLMATPSGKHRTRERERLWKANGGRGVVAYAQSLETMLKNGVPTNLANTGFIYSINLAGFFDPNNASANAVPDALAKLPTIKPLTQQYDDPSDKQVEEEEEPSEAMGELTALIGELQSSINAQQEEATDTLAGEPQPPTNEEPSEAMNELNNLIGELQSSINEQQQPVAETMPADVSPLQWQWSPDEAAMVEQFFGDADKFLE